LNNIIVDGTRDVEETRLLASLPSEYPEDLTQRIEDKLRDRPNEMVIYLEDDSTGVQKSHDVFLITDYSEQGIHSGILAARKAGHRLSFILTNSRALSTRQADELNRRTALAITAVARAEDLTVRVGSRSDSTLRGHFPLEPLVLMETIEPLIGTKFDGIILTYAFLTEMSRITVNGVHLIRMRKGDGTYCYRPVHLTGFAKDRRFGYPTSDMAEYTEYKYATSGLGNVKARDVLHVSLDTIRIGGPEEVKRRLMEAENQRIVTVDVVTPRDLQVIVLGLLMAEGEGKNYIYRSAASLAATRVNMQDIPVLSIQDILGPGAKRLAGNILCLWGSIVELSNQQLEAVLNQTPKTSSTKFDVRGVLDSCKSREEVMVSAIKDVEDAFAQGRNAVVYTYPRTVYPAEELTEEVRAANEQKIASALQDVYNRLSTRPGAVIFKGGTTSSTGLFNCGARRVYVLGQIAPGTPVVKILPEDNERFPGQEMLIVIGPGNVGVRESYVSIFEKLTGEEAVRGSNTG
jgi:uncharacterized protein YgbK (DUF1537 family)